MKKLFLLLSLCCISFAAWADEYTDENGVTWEYWISSYWDDASQKEVYYVRIISISGYSSEVVVPNFITVGGTNYEVQYIEQTFQYKSDISSITLPSSLKSISPGTFYCCSSLVTINIPEGFTEIGENAFNSCEKLTSITIPRSVTSIGDYAFSGCSSLREVTISENVTAIGNYAFSGCNSLNIVLPASVKTVGDSAFNGCIVSLNATDPVWLTMNANSTYFDGATIVVPDEAYTAYTTSSNWEKYVSNIYAVSEMVQHTFTDDNSVTWTFCYVLSTSSARIVNAEGYTTDIDVPATLPYNEGEIPVTAIEHNFGDDANITTVDLSKTSITTTPSFQNCSSLETVLLPTTLETISEYTFANCDNLQSIDLSGTSVKGIDSWAFEGCDNLTTIVFPSTLETIGNSVFYACMKIQDIDLSQTKLNSIGENAFYDNYGLLSVSFPSSVKKIGNYAFANNWNLSEIDLSMVEEIGEQAFSYCYALISIDISSATSIGSNAFAETPDDATFTINATTPASIKANSFTGNSKFIVNPNAYDTFCSTTIWKNWADNISMFHVDENSVKWIYRNLQDSNGMRITGASGYGEEVTIPYTLPYNGQDANVTHIGDVFSGTNVTSVTLPATLTSIDNNTFSNCRALTSIEIPASVTTIEVDAFHSCTSLKSVIFEANTAIQTIGNGAFMSCALTSIEIPASVTSVGNKSFRLCKNLATVTFEDNSALLSIGEGAFYDCDALVSIKIPTSVTTLGDDAFRNCNHLATITFEENSAIQSIGKYAFYGSNALKEINLSKVEEIGEGSFKGINFSSVDLSSATSVGYQAFTANGNEEPLITINNETPATIASGAFPESAMFLVPGDAATTYKSADVWSDYASRIFGRDVAIQTINVTAQEKGSGVLEAIGGNENQTNIIDLTVKGTINGYDFVMFKDKMPNLRFLDLTDAKIVYNPYCYYEQHHSQNDTLGAYAFYQENKLLSITLPKDIKYIGEYAFSDCYKLTHFTLPNTITFIGDYAFCNCSSLVSITIPNSVTAIGGGAFQNTGLTEIILPNKLERIGSSAFQSTQLKEIAFPTTLTTIEWGAFGDCGQLETVRIPSSLQYISDYAFGGCSNLKNVYTYTIEPTDINENTFSNFETVQLYVPTASGQNYYWNEGWKRFVNVAEFDEVYEYFYLNNDHTLNESTGAIDGTPDADLNAGSGLTVEEGVEQEIGDLNIQHDGTNGGSIIAGSEDGNIHADNLHVNINVESGRWYFFCFPFDLKKENISIGKENTQYIFRWYDGEERANGKSGWKNVTESEGSYLKAATGYIFQCSQSDVLTISLADVKFKKENKYNELVANTAENLQDASWNFVGNPYLSYYDMNSVGYDAPITVWNGETYEAIKPGDDDYHFAPFEAFFVQKPEGTDSIEFDGDAQTTYNGAQAQQQETGARSIRRTDGYRKLVNIILSNGEKSDRTRIVFNDKVSMEYELACDAAKFEAAGVPQLYTIDSRAVKYAINERPVAEGIVTLGYTVPTEGIYTLDAPRMDTQVSVRDNLTRTIHRFDEGSYEFYSEAGTFEGRFTILTNSGATGIENVELDEQHEEIYNLNGQRVNKVTGKGIYIKNNRKEVNM